MLDAVGYLSMPVGCDCGGADGCCCVATSMSSSVGIGSSCVGNWVGVVSDMDIDMGSSVDGGGVVVVVGFVMGIRGEGAGVDIGIGINDDGEGVDVGIEIGVVLNVLVDGGVDNSSGNVGVPVPPLDKLERTPNEP